MTANKVDGRKGHTIDFGHLFHSLLQFFNHLQSKNVEIEKRLYENWNQSELRVMGYLQCVHRKSNSTHHLSMVTATLIKCSTYHIILFVSVTASLSTFNWHSKDTRHELLPQIHVSMISFSMAYNIFCLIYKVFPTASSICSQVS
jgi:hypothetical protein